MKNKWGKVLVIGLLATTSFTAHSRGIEQKIENKINRIQAMTDRMQRALYSMNQRELNQTHKKLKQAIQALKGNSGPTRPTPPTPRPPHNRLVTVTGSIENQSFMLDVTNSIDFANQCIAQFAHLGQTDEAKVSVNFGTSQKITTSKWWYSAGEVCANLAAKAVELGLPTNNYEIATVGAIENKTFSFAGNSLREIMMQCTQFYHDSNLGSTDEVVIFNGTTKVKKTTSGWWYNSNDVCEKIIQEL